MVARISKRGEVEIEFYVVHDVDGIVSIWTKEPPALPGLRRYGPYTATAEVQRELAPR